MDNTVTRFRNGKYVIYSKPEKINYSRSKSAVAARTKFGNTVRFAKFVNSDEVLSNLWKRSKVSGTNVYQKRVCKKFCVNGLSKGLVKCSKAPIIINNYRGFYSSLFVNHSARKIYSSIKPLRLRIPSTFGSEPLNRLYRTIGSSLPPLDKMFSLKDKAIF